VPPSTAATSSRITENFAVPRLLCEISGPTFIPPPRRYWQGLYRYEVTDFHDDHEGCQIQDRWSCLSPIPRRTALEVCYVPLRALGTRIRTWGENVRTTCPGLFTAAGRGDDRPGGNTRATSGQSIAGSRGSRISVLLPDGLRHIAGPGTAAKPGTKGERRCRERQ
jgi:hypothetical protein